jgi:hypothetical protein
MLCNLQQTQRFFCGNSTRQDVETSFGGTLLYTCWRHNGIDGYLLWRRSASSKSTANPSNMVWAMMRDRNSVEWQELTISYWCVDLIIIKSLHRLGSVWNVMPDNALSEIIVKTAEFARFPWQTAVVCVIRGQEPRASDSGPRPRLLCAL